MGGAGSSSANSCFATPSEMQPVLTELIFANVKPSDVLPVLFESDLTVPLTDDVKQRPKRTSGRGFPLAPLFALLVLGAALGLWTQFARPRHVESSRSVPSLMTSSGARSALPADVSPLHPSSHSIFSVRVAKALGSRGYDKIRLSVVRDAQSVRERLGEDSKSLQQPLGAKGQQVDWTYTSEFRERWTDMHLSSAVVPVVPGETQTFDVYGQSVSVKVPRNGEGVVGLIVGDVCFEGLWPCTHAAAFDPKNTLLSVIHGLVEHDELDYWINVGDLLYDPDGSQNVKFFSELSLEAQAKIHTMTVGNHDYWFNGDYSICHAEWYGDREVCGVEHNLGFGFMQWYAQDAMSAKEDATQPFHLNTSRSPGEVAHFSNFFWYNMVGNVALISFTGQSSWQSQAPYFEEACDWAQAQDPALLVLLGHWNEVNSGAAEGMATPEVYVKMMAIPGCAAIGVARAKFIDGHEHCNKISQNGTGFQFGAFGAHGCGDFGIPILDTRGGQATLFYFPLGVHGIRVPQWQDVIDCLKTKGLAGCTPYADVWMQQSLSPLMG